MDKETLSNYGWIVICVLVLSVMLAFASPFGTFIAGAIKSTTAGLFNVNQAALGSAGINVDDMVFENCDHLETEVRNVSDTYTGDTCCKACGAVLQAGQKVRAKVPAGGLYTAADGTVYNPGDEMPETPTTGDVYKYEDYMYGYNMHSACGQNGIPSWKTDEEINGWGVNTISEKKSYGYMLHEINGAPVVSLQYTFSYIDYDIQFPSDFTIPTTTRYVERMFMYADITHLPSTFVLPEGITSMYEMFKTTSLTDLSDFVIPSTVTNLENTFQYCGSLKVAPKIPNGVTNMHMTFNNCTSLIVAPEIPKSVTDIGCLFYGCSSLTTAPDLSHMTHITNMGQVFAGCTNLKTYHGSADPDGDFSGYVIPDSVSSIGMLFYGCKQLIIAPELPANASDMFYAFKDCTNLTTAPIIPSKVTSMGYTFDGCTNLKTYHGSVDPDGDFSGYVIPGNVNGMAYTFKNCTSMIVAPQISNGVSSLKGTFYGCSNLTTMHIIPISVSNMNETFYNCTSLTGTLTINGSASNYPYSSSGYENCFYGTEQNITITGTNNEMLALLAGTANNGNVTVQ